MTTAHSIVRLAKALLLTVTILLSYANNAEAREQATIVIGQDCEPARPLAGADPALPAAVSQWRHDVSRHIRRFQYHPPEAITHRERGLAVVRFVMDRNGNLLDSKIVRSSGVSRLDEAALMMVRRANPVPSAPSELPGNKFTLNLPIAFSQMSPVIQCSPVALQRPATKSVADIKSASSENSLSAGDKISLAKEFSACGISEIKAGHVTFRLRLDRDGKLADLPGIESKTEGQPDAAHIAARAELLKCGPFRLPAETYESLREVIVTFSSDAPQLDKETKTPQSKAQKRRQQ